MGALNEDKAIEILLELIRKPESRTEELPVIWSMLLKVHEENFNPPVPEVKRKRRSRNPNIGWPAGVGREEYRAWKEKQQSMGLTEGLNPQTYKRERDAGAA